MTEAFAALRRAGTGGQPGNLAVLHSPVLRSLAVRYWAATMRSPRGELYFAAHCRHAGPEMRDLAAQVTRRLAGASRTSELRRLLLSPSRDRTGGQQR